MVRILRAFAWMRWRVLLNSLERNGSRDILERLSLATEQLGPIIAMVLLVPSLIAVAGVSAFGGYALASKPDSALPFTFLRFLMLAISGFAILGPVLLPVMERTNPVRLLLLPIPRSTLYLAQACGALADPWTLVALPIAVFLPLGLAIGGAPGAALLAFLAGIVFVAAIVGLSTLTALVVQLVMRDRRRGELVALAFILLMPMIGMLTNMADGGGSRRARRGSDPVTRPAGVSITQRLTRGAMLVAPSERYVSATRHGVAARPADGAADFGILAGMTALLHAAAVYALGRVLAFPGSGARRRGGAVSGKAARRLPGLSAGANAVAVAQLRLALRTPRGRSMMISPVLVFIVMSVIAFRSGGSFLSGGSQGGLGIAIFGALIAIIATLPFALNQFAIDGAGLTLELLSPLSDADLLDGKAVANSIIAGGTALFCVGAAYLLFHKGLTSVWVSMPLGVLSVCLLVTPGAGVASAVFPRAVDLNSVGQRSNAHGFAGLLGFLMVPLSALPAFGLVLLARLFGRLDLAPLLLLMWCAVAFAINRLLARPIRLLLAKRRENLALVIK
jgi:hypothetical protein